ncbi:hypothetical protein BL254_18510 [Protofrankia sp. BMG5.30]|uniref:Uncharacterized protein n=1 Tax=Protofrankia coriariae TaxID=1562887 RepID=A0ABR5F2C9_9ACTN|nr:hypothetical protein FrCorBMG51_15545 [Protofrankia coriariae]ONH34030.1 hypothetical protein BL254_18510 [Protofrankia sp. BMG5.30]
MPGGRPSPEHRAEGATVSWFAASYPTAPRPTTFQLVQDVTEAGTGSQPVRGDRHETSGKSSHVYAEIV